jgi:hypothetical protein
MRDREADRKEKAKMSGSRSRSLRLGEVSMAAVVVSHGDVAIFWCGAIVTSCSGIILSYYSSVMFYSVSFSFLLPCTIALVALKGALAALIGATCFSIVSRHVVSTLRPEPI